MELRVLQYFLAVAREGSISGAAEQLHITQPTLSRQLKELEDELGTQLLTRGNRNVSLTADGMLLRRRAEEIVSLVHRTESELLGTGETLTGSIHIGAAESSGLHPIMRAAKLVQGQQPGICFHVTSGDSEDLRDRLDRGLLDFALVLGEPDATRYDGLPMSIRDRWGILMPADSPLAAYDAIAPEQLRGLPLILSLQAQRSGELINWLHAAEPYTTAATCNLVHTAAVMVSEGLGYALVQDQWTPDCPSDSLVFRPLTPTPTIGISLIWKKYQLFSRPAEYFLSMLRNTML